MDRNIHSPFNLLFRPLRQQWNWYPEIDTFKRLRENDHSMPQKSQVCCRPWCMLGFSFDLLLPRSHHTVTDKISSCEVRKAVTWIHSHTGLFYLILLTSYRIRKRWTYLVHNTKSANCLPRKKQGLFQSQLEMFLRRSRGWEPASNYNEMFWSNFVKLPNRTKVFHCC